MFLNAQRRSLFIYTCIIVSLIVSVIAGCRMLSYRRQENSFSHRVHIEKKISCNGCHYDFEIEATAGMPSYTTCLACHGPSKSRPPYDYERKIQKHDKLEKFVFKEQIFDLKFSHKSHYKKKIACKACHGAVSMSSAISTINFPSYNTCETCHLKKGFGTACSSCHKSLNRKKRPPSHVRGAWKRNHGRGLSIISMGGHSGNCMLCHSQSECNECHQVEKPIDHTGFFRAQGHGISVGIDRERCMVCHKENYCIRCHNETKPRSHYIASWGGRQSNHCLFCHDPISSGKCMVCHRTTMSHNLAPRIPGPPHAISKSQCYKCHLKPPHADNFSPCTSCHK